MKQKRDQLVSNLDVVATIEQLARVTPGLRPDGQSLLQLFDYADVPWRSALLLENKAGFAVRTATRKYVKYNGGSEELYDLAADPHELENRTGDANYESDLASLRSSLGRLKSQLASRASNDSGGSRLFILRPSRRLADDCPRSRRYE